MVSNLVDVWLRPEGRSAPVVISLPSYRGIFTTRRRVGTPGAVSSPAVAGDSSLCSKVGREIQACVYGRPLDRETVAGFAESANGAERNVARRVSSTSRGGWWDCGHRVYYTDSPAPVRQKARQLLSLQPREVIQHSGSDRGGGVTVGALRPFSRGGEGMRMISDRAYTTLPTAAGDLRLSPGPWARQERGALETEMKEGSHDPYAAHIPADDPGVQRSFPPDTGSSTGDKLS